MDRARIAVSLILIAASSSILGAQARVDHPFAVAVGERAEYDVKYGVIHAGTASLAVVSIDTVRSRDAYRFRLTLTAGVNALLYKYSVRDTMQSWVDTAGFRSLRFYQDQLDGGRTRTKRYEIFPDRRVYTDGAQPEQPSVADPLDDIAFLYFVRSQTLNIGSSNEWSRYFKPGSNPVVLKVLGRDTIDAMGKRWSTIVVQPIIKTSTLFSKNGDARVWISDDSARVIVQINTKVSFGSITMRLTSYQPARAAGASGAGAPGTTTSPPH